MSYTTAGAIVVMLPSLPQTTTAAGWTTTAAIISQHLTRAYNLINMKLAKKYATPFAATYPPMVVSLEEDFACYYTMRSLYTRDAQNNSEWAVEHYEKAITILDELADVSGKGLDLLASDGSLVSQRVGAGTSIQTSTDYSPAFELDDDTDWAVDGDRLDAVESDRDS